MDHKDFKRLYESLYPKPTEVVRDFLAGRTDTEIARERGVDRSAITHHIRNVCHHFGLKDAGDYSHCRPELVELFSKYKPEIVSSEVLKRYNCQTPARIEPEVPEGSVALDSAFYVERPPIESNCYKVIVQPGALIRIKAPKQMGKTSLLYRILYSAEKQIGSRTVNLNLGLADQAVLSSLETFLRWFCASVSKELGLPNKLAEYWYKDFGSNSNCTAYFEEYLLAEKDSPLTLGLDEIERIFLYPKIAEDFLALLRDWNNKAANRQIWKRFRLVLAHSTEEYIPLDINRSPFNVGLKIELSEFTPEQIHDLAGRHGLDWLDGKEVLKLREIMGGHPYLVRLALYHLSCQQSNWEQLLKEAATESGIYCHHLRTHLGELKKHPELKEAMRQVVVATKPVRLDQKQVFQLRSMGLVELQGNKVIPRCSLYHQYFRDHLD